MSMRGRLVLAVTFVAIGVVGAPSVSLAASGGQPSLLGEWHMDTVQSAEVPDTPSTVNSTDGLQIYGAQQVPGQFGQAFSFNGAQRNYLVADGTDFQPAQITVMAWVKASSSPGTNKAIVAKGGDTDCGLASYALYSAAGGLAFYVAASRSTTISSPVVPAAQIWNGQWHAVVATYDGTAVRLYVDGALVGSPTASNGAAIDYALDDTAFTVGDFQPCAGFSFTGSIDEVRVYNGALSDAQVAQVSSGTGTTPPELGGTATTTTTTPTGGSTTPPTAPTVVLKPFAGGLKGGSTIFTTIGTTGASQLNLDINGDGKTDVTAPASLPYFQITGGKSSATNLKLTALGPSGLSTSTAVTATVKGPSLPFNGASPQFAVFSQSPQDMFGVLERGAEQATCAPTEIDAGIIGAYGCFQHLTEPSQVPASETATANAYYAGDVAKSTLYMVDCVLAASPAANCPNWQKFYAANYNVWVADTRIKINGMTLTPALHSEVVVDPLDGHVFSSNAILKIGPFTIKEGPVDLDFTDIYFHANQPTAAENLTYTGQTQALLSFDAQKYLSSIGGFALSADASLQFASNNGVRESLVTLHAELPPFFNSFGSGDPPSGAATVVATNAGPIDQSDFSLNTVDLSVPNASIGGVGLTNLLFHYDVNGDPEPGVTCPAKYWSVSGNVYLGEGDDGSAGPAILMSPPPFNGIRFCQGAFNYFGATVDFGGAAPELFPGVFLNAINFQLGLNPTVLIGGATLSAADITEVQGALLAVFAHPWEPYTLTAGAAGPALQDLVGRTFTSTSFAIGGAVGINVPGVGDLNIAHGGMVYEYPDYFALGASVNTDLGIFTFDGSVGGQFIVDRGLFEIDASAHICIAGFDIACAGGLLVASEKGAVACVQLGPLNPGIGVKTDGSVDVWIPDGCKPSHYWSDARNYAHVAGHAAAAPITFTVAKGETSKSIKLIGSGGAPHVTLTGPGGQSMTVGGDGAFSQGALEGISSSHYSGTWLGLKNAQPGTYTVTPLPGSVAIASIAETRPGYDSNFTAKVTGTGSRLTLHYDARKRGGGQHVTFFEQGENIMRPLVTSNGGKGTVKFTPSPGAGGRRAIVARATVDDTQIQDQTLTHFRFRGTPKAGTPGKVTVQRKKANLLVNWTAAAGTTRYGVLVTNSDGAQRRYTVSASHRSLVVKRYPLTTGGRVSVSARGALGDWGKARKSKAFKATQAPPTILLTKKNAKKHKKKTTKKTTTKKK
jgi:hypothetical protein